MFALAICFNGMDAGAEQAELDSTQLFEVLPRKNNKTRGGTRELKIYERCDYNY